MPERPTVSNTSCLIGLDRIGHLDLLNHALVQSIRSELGGGEAEAIALAIEASADRLILDDRLARRAAQRLNLTITGTVGVVLRAKERGFIRAVKPVLDDLVKAEFYLSPELIQRALQIAGE